MNRVQGHIVDIETGGNLSIVTVEITEQIRLKAIVIETPETAGYLQKGGRIKMLFKETEVIVGTGEDHSISLQNRIPGKIKEIEKGKLLSRIVVDTAAGEITSIISTNAVVQLGIKPESDVMAMIKLNEVMLSEL